MRCRSVSMVVVIASVAVMGACGGEGPAETVGSSTAGSTPVTVEDRLGRVDPDPYDGKVGDIELTSSEIGYRDKFELTDLEAHDAFGYSCGISQNAEPIERFANQPTEPVEP
ncbi:MAG: hypothetical protein GY812_02160 [Actinomycetia bacterium]|nr:hypothetical protein [Actinomycetes bacterium]